MKFKKYRIVTDNYLGYEIQLKYFLLPFWFQISVQEKGVNTFFSIAKAQMYIEKLNKKVVKN
jgi:hypothetical protein